MRNNWHVNILMSPSLLGNGEQGEELARTGGGAGNKAACPHQRPGAEGRAGGRRHGGQQADPPAGASHSQVEEGGGAGASW